MDAEVLLEFKESSEIHRRRTDEGLEGICFRNPLTSILLGGGRIFCRKLLLACPTHVLSYEVVIGHLWKQDIEHLSWRLRVLGIFVLVLLGLGTLGAHRQSQGLWMLLSQLPLALSV